MPVCPQVGRVRLLTSPEDLRAAEREAAGAEGVVVMDASNWQVGPVPSPASISQLLHASAPELEMLWVAGFSTQTEASKS
jgi:hypothetical protein